MYQYNYSTGEWEHLFAMKNCARSIIYCDNNYIEFGMANLDFSLPIVNIDGTDYQLFNPHLLHKYFYYEGRSGRYHFKKSTSRQKDVNLNKGQGGYPYLFQQKYEAIHNFALFKNKEKVVLTQDFNYAKYLPFTFGLEFETSSGYIPQHICFENGLIPLRDGSISGVEYSSIVLQGNRGLNLLLQEIETLKKYTLHDKECSLHMHIGGFPVSSQLIFVLHVVFAIFQNELLKYCPLWTFESGRYKRTGKNYCKQIPIFKNFDQFYEFVAGKKYEGSLYQPHPYDEDRHQKWHINSRYFAFNFVNLMCYESPKTIEFRFLRPTYNFYEIETWLLVFSALIHFAIKISTECRADDYDTVFKYIIAKTGKYNVIFKILESIYPDDLAGKLKQRIKSLQNANMVARYRGDHIGNTTYKDDFLMKTSFNNPL